MSEFTIIDWTKLIEAWKLDEALDMLKNHPYLINKEGGDVIKWYPVHTVALYDSLEILEYLYENGANIEKLDSFGRTPLLIAVEKENIDIVKFLLENNANIEAKNIFGETPLFIALQDKNKEIIEYLIKAGADVNATSKDIDGKGNTLLNIAIEEENVEDMNFLIDYGIALNTKNKEGYPPIHKILLKNKKFSSDIALKLLNAGVDINSEMYDGSTVLCSAIEGNSQPVFDYLLASGVNIDTSVKFGYFEGYTPLHFTCRYRDAYMTWALLKHNANINIKNRDDETPLELLIKKKYLHFVKLFIKTACNIEITDEYFKENPFVDFDKIGEVSFAYLQEKIDKLSEKVDECREEKKAIIKEKLELYINNYVDDEKIKKILLETIDLGVDASSGVMNIDAFYESGGKNLFFLWGIIGGYNKEFLLKRDMMMSFTKGSKLGCNYNIITIESTEIKLENPNVDNEISKHILIYIANTTSLSKSEKLKTLEWYKTIPLEQAKLLLNVLESEVTSIKKLSSQVAIDYLVEMKKTSDKEWKKIEISMKKGENE